MKHDWWWQRHDEDGNADELQMNGLHNFEDDFDGEYDDGINNHAPKSH